MVEVTVLYLFTITVVNVIKRAPNKVNKKYMLKFSNPGWVTNNTPKSPEIKEAIIKKFNFSFKNKTANIPAKIGDDIFNVVNSGREMFLSEINVMSGIGANIRPLIKGI